MMMELNERGEAQFELRYVERDVVIQKNRTSLGNFKKARISEKPVKWA